MKGQRHTVYFTRGMAGELAVRFGMRTTQPLRRIVSSGGVGLREADREVYRYIWEHRYELLAAAFIDTFEKNDRLFW